MLCYCTNMLVPPCPPSAGVGGSGKQSLARLAAHICGFQTHMIVISGSYGLNAFREDLQKMYRRAGQKGEGVMFLFTDSQVRAALLLPRSPACFDWPRASRPLSAACRCALLLDVVIVAGIATSKRCVLGCLCHTCTITTTCNARSKLGRSMQRHKLGRSMHKPST